MEPVKPAELGLLLSALGEDLMRLKPFLGEDGKRYVRIGEEEAVRYGVIAQRLSVRLAEQVDI